MLSDEEMKAIDYLQLCYDLSTITNESLSKLGIVLNIIEKQSKEIEELRHGLEENTEEIDKLYKIINLMAEELADWYMDNRIDNRKIDKQYVINKFTNKIRGINNE